jgi:hypothetical protein
MKMSLIELIKKQVELHGLDIDDTKEIIGYDSLLSGRNLEDLSRQELNPKYELELEDIKDWFDHERGVDDTRRQIIYFNNKDFINRKQCISTIQILDDIMVIYQRSGSVEKMSSDHRFFYEIRKQFFPNVNYIKIFYGSLHYYKTNSDD